MARLESVTLIIPALNEAAVIGRVVADLLRALPPSVKGRVVVVDNGSTDQTAATAAAAGATVVSEPIRGYGRACAAGVAAAGADDVLVLLDGDGSDDPRDLPAILGPILRDEADLVVGVRSRREGGSMTPQQLAGNRVAILAIGVLYGGRVRDLGPFRAIRRRQLESLEMSEMTFGWSTEMIVKAFRAGLRYREVETTYRRRVGVSKVGGTLAGSLQAGWSILGTAVRHRTWRPSEPVARVGGVR